MGGAGQTRGKNRRDEVNELKGMIWLSVWVQAAGWVSGWLGVRYYRIQLYAIHSIRALDE